MRRAKDEAGPAVEAARLAVAPLVFCVAEGGAAVAGFAAPPNRPPVAGVVDVAAPVVVGVVPAAAVVGAGVVLDEAGVPPLKRPPVVLAGAAAPVVADASPAGFAPKRDPVVVGAVLDAGALPAGLAPNRELAAAGAAVGAGAAAAGVPAFPNKDGDAAAVVEGVVLVLAVLNREGFDEPVSAGFVACCPNKDGVVAAGAADAPAAGAVVADGPAGFAPKRLGLGLAAPSVGFAAPKRLAAGFAAWPALLPKREVGAGDVAG